MLRAMTRHLDCKGLKCPMPIVQLSIAARELQPGDELTVEADDPAFRADLHAWARRAGFSITQFVDGQVRRATVVKR